MSRFTITDRDIAQLWEVVATHRKRAGDKPGAQMAKWTAKSWRSREFPIGIRPEDVKL